MGYGTSHRPDLKQLLCFRSTKKHREAIRCKAREPREALTNAKRVSRLVLPKTALINQTDALEGLHRKERPPPGGSPGCDGSSSSSLSTCSFTLRCSLVHRVESRRSTCPTPASCSRCSRAM